MPRRLTPWKETGTQSTGSWAGPTAGTDRRGKSRSPPGLDPRTVHPAASYYTDDAILRYVLVHIPRDADYETNS